MYIFGNLRNCYVLIMITVFSGSVMYDGININVAHYYVCMYTYVHVHHMNQQIGGDLVGCQLICLHLNLMTDYYSDVGTFGNSEG